MTNKRLYGRLMKNGTKKNLVQIFDHLLTLHFLAVTNLSMKKLLTVTEKFNP